VKMGNLLHVNSSNMTLHNAQLTQAFFSIFRCMAYIAMARKWRPMKFADLVGQEHIARTFQNAIEGGRLHHAFLFTGTRGVGKTTSARILARTLNCTGANQLDPCGECPSCKDIATGNPMDVIEIDAASHTGVDDMREILEQTRYTPMIGKYKVFVVDEVHMLSKSAFNALLKTLEEPPAHVIFIFATTEVNKVPQTILSRVQRFDFKRISSRLIAERLHFICTQEKIVDDPDALVLIADKADGSMRDALTYFDQVFAFSGESLSAEATHKVLGIPPDSLFFDLVTAIFAHDQKACFETIDKACAMGIELSVFLDGLARFLRNLLYARVSGLTAESLEITDAYYKQLQSVAPDASNGDVLRLAKILSDTQSQLKGATSPRLLVETAFARMAWLDRVADLKKILQGFESQGSPEADKKKILSQQVAAQSADSGIAPQRPQAFASLSSQDPTSIKPFAPAASAQAAPISVQAFAPITQSSHDDEVVISFGDEPSEQRAPSTTKFEVVNQWKRVQKDFCNVEPLAGAYLEGTSVQRGDYSTSPFPLKIIFRGDSAFNYTQISQSPAYIKMILEYLETVLQTRIDLRLELQAPAPGDIPVKRAQVRSSFERDKEREPILAFLAETFEANLVSSRSLAIVAKVETNETNEYSDEEQ